MSLVLLFFDFSSILLSARFIIIFPLLFVFSKSFKSLTLKLCLSVFLILLTHFILQPNWASYYRNQINNESLIINNLEDLKLNNLIFFNSENDIYVLDVWYSKCSVCYKNMEELKKWAKNNPKFQKNIILVNILLDGENFEENKKIVEKYGFYSTYSNLSFEELKKLGVQTYPTQIVVRNTKIIFVGDLEVDKKVILNNINDYLY